MKGKCKKHDWEIYTLAGSDYKCKKCGRLGERYTKENAYGTKYLIRQLRDK